MANADAAFLRVRDAAVILGISRSTAYELANAWLATEGRTGIPAVRLGRTIRIPRAALQRLAAIGTVDGPPVGLVG